MNAKKDKTITEHFTELVKQFFSVATGVGAALLCLNSYVKTTIKESVNTAFAEVVIPMQTTLKEITPIVKENDKALSLLTYRLGVAEHRLNLLPTISKDIQKPEDIDVKTAK
jgi:hypothetical protein